VEGKKKGGRRWGRWRRKTRRRLRGEWEEGKGRREVKGGRTRREVEWG